MTGTKYAPYFKTGQYGRLYIVSGSHARGRTFRIYVLPEGEEAKGNGENNPPLNPNAVEVYGIVGGQPGWTESYGWLHEGKWQEDLNALYEQKVREEHEAALQKDEAERGRQEDRKKREAELLASYN
jgi:hypothetical protein